MILAMEKSSINIELILVSRLCGKAIVLMLAFGIRSNIVKKEKESVLRLFAAIFFTMYLVS